MACQSIGPVFPIDNQQRHRVNRTLRSNGADRRVEATAALMQVSLTGSDASAMLDAMLDA